MQINGHNNPIGTQHEISSQPKSNRNQFAPAEREPNCCRVDKHLWAKLISIVWNLHRELAPSDISRHFVTQISYLCRLISLARVFTLHLHLAMKLERNLMKRSHLLVFNGFNLLIGIKTSWTLGQKAKAEWRKSTGAEDEPRTIERDYSTWTGKTAKLAIRLEKQEAASAIR